jgi:hypothetical protein
MLSTAPDPAQQRDEPRRTRPDGAFVADGAALALSPEEPEVLLDRVTELVAILDAVGDVEQALETVGH